MPNAFKIGLIVLFATALSGIALYMLFPHFSFRIEHFEYWLVEHGISWISAPIISRVSIGLLFVYAAYLLVGLIPIKWLKFVPPILVILPFLLNPVYPSNFNSEEIDVTAMLDTGSHTMIAAYFSPNCIFCLEGARKLKAAKNASSNFPEIKVFSTSEKIADLLEYAGADLEYELISKDLFLRITKGSYPKYVIIQDDDPVWKLDNAGLNYKVLQTLSELDL